MRRDVTGRRSAPGILHKPEIHDLTNEHSLGGPCAVLVEGNTQRSKDFDFGFVPENLRIDEQAIHVEERCRYFHSVTFTQVYLPASYYGVKVTKLEPLSSATVEAVVALVVARQRALAVAQPLISPHVDAEFLASALLSAASDVLVALQARQVVGHLRGTTLENEVFGKSVWINPEGLTYDTTDILATLYSELGARWLANDATRHFVWVPTNEVDREPWLELGFSFMHQRGTLALSKVTPLSLPNGYTIRRGSLDDLDAAIELDLIIQRAQEQGPSFSLNFPNSQQRNEWTETLEDPDVTHLFVESNGLPIAQCATFALPQRLGSFPETVHLSAVSVRDDHQRRGIARAMVSFALHHARSQGFIYGETNWRVTNRYAAHYWTNFGFTPTYTRLQRRVGTD